MLEFLQGTDLLKQRLEQERGITPARLSEMVAQKKEEFAGLLNEQAAVYAIAKEHGITADAPKAAFQATKIAHLDEKSRGVNLLCAVKRVQALKTFERNGKQGSLVSMQIEDDSGMMRMVLWNRDAERAERGDIEKGDTVEIRGAYAKPSLAGGIELHLGLSGDIRRAEPGKKEKSLPKIASLADGMAEVDALGRILELGERTEFEKNGKKGSVLPCLMGDESAQIRLALWDASPSLAGRLKTGDVVKVENGYVRSSQAGSPELHINWAGRLIINPRNAKVAHREEILKVPIVKISELKEGEKSEIRARLADFSGADPMHCAFEDESGRIECDVQGRLAYKIAGIKKLADDIEFATVLKLKRESLIGREFFILGKKSAGKFEVENAVS